MKTLTDSKKKLIRCKEKVDQLKTCFEITTLLNSKLNLESLLNTIMKTAKKVMKADACTLMLIDEESDELIFQIALSEVGERIKELSRHQRLKIGQGIAGTVAKTGQSMLIKDAYKHHKFNPEYDKKTGFQTGSILCTPIKVKGEIIGVCQVIHHRTKKKIFTDSDLSLFRMFCESAALAIQNARFHQTMLEVQRMEQDMEFALSVQQSFMPQDIPKHEQFVFAAKTVPARVVGGDFYDFIKFNEDMLGIVVGDVSGKGVSGALQMARLMSDFRYMTQVNPEPDQVMHEVNNILCERSKKGMFTTAVYILLDMKQKKLSLANAGHHPLLLRSKAREVESKAKASGPPLGILPNFLYTREEIPLKRGDMIFLYTDGVTESKNKNNNQFGLEKLRDMIRINDSSLDDFLVRLEKSVHRFSGKVPQFDDLTFVTFEAI